MPKLPPLAVTGVCLITPIGVGAEEALAAILGGLSGYGISDEFVDHEDHPIVVAEIPVIDDLTDDRDCTARVAMMLDYGIRTMLSDAGPSRDNTVCHVFIGMPAPERPVPNGDDEDDDTSNNAVLANSALAAARHTYPRAVAHGVPFGNASAFRALRLAAVVLEHEPDAVAIVCASDSWLDAGLIDWLGAEYRLKSERYGSHQGLVPGEGAGFLLLESPAAAKRGRRRPLALLRGIGEANEGSPFTSQSPSQANGLTDAIRQAIDTAALAGRPITAVWGDLNGEFYRAREWAYADVRCLSGANRGRRIRHPADCYGDIGIASGPVLLGLGTLALHYGIDSHAALCFCSDDFGARGAAVLTAFEGETTR